MLYKPAKAILFGPRKLKRMAKNEKITATIAGTAVLSLLSFLALSLRTNDVLDRYMFTSLAIISGIVAFRKLSNNAKSHNE